ncbi:unnamed protein product [Thelazia callipaeda]|uniref:Chromosome 1 open reading frame 172 n=1 Tax=Thelazia callipaeda TaxID=103827 RepID=A0A0N5D1J0_THECL|nr:unnamed protein product [Thelazia callipaeda]
MIFQYDVLLSLRQNDHQRKEHPRLRSDLQRQRTSGLRRCPAFENTYLPGKQFSSPLPCEQQRRLYKKDHVLSRSWNPERYDYRQVFTKVANQKLLEQVDKATLSSDYNYVFSREYANLRDTLTVSPELMGYPIHCQVTLYDQKLANVTKRRETEINRRKANLRQQTLSHSISNEKISQECLELWADRRNLEVHGVHQQQQSSTEKSASTSFESNTEPIQRDQSDYRRRSSFLHVLRSANYKRQQYRSLLTHRKSDRRRVNPSKVSLNDAFPTDSIAPMVINVETFSTDSTKSDQTVISHGLLKKFVYKHKIAFANLFCNALFEETSNGVGYESPSVSSESKSEQQTVNQPIKAQSCAYFNIFSSSVPTIRPPANASTDATSYTIGDCLRRDYSIDSETDRLFQEFVRFDPRYDKPNHSITQQRGHSAHRR